MTKKTQKIASHLGTPRVAWYGRYSTDNQRETSIDDQLRRCTDFAEARGLAIAPDLIFMDQAISGKEVEARPGYQLLLSAWDQGLIDVLLVDSQSRLFRDEIECAVIKQKIRKSGVRVMSTSGTDTGTPGWELTWSFTGLIDAKYRDDTTHNVLRGMEGALARGYTCGEAPYGYKRRRVYTSAGDHEGTHWDVDPATAPVVQRIFQERSDGLSYNDIAARLIADGIPSPSGGLWAASSITGILRRRVYTGEEHWGSSTSRAHRYAKREETPTPAIVVSRPELRLVDADLWASVQPGTRTLSATGRGGGVQWAAGLCRCGLCDTVLTVKYNVGPASFSVYCSTCSKRRRLVGDVVVPYIDTRILAEVFKKALLDLFTPAVRAAFEARLLDRLEGGIGAEIEKVEAEISQKDRACSRLITLISAVEDDALAKKAHADLIATRDARRALQARHAALLAGRGAASPEEMRKQLSASPAPLIERLFTEAPPGALRAALHRIFPRVVFDGRPDAHKRFCYFTLHAAPGVASALATGTSVSDAGTVPLRFKVSSSSRRAIPATVEPVAEDEALAFSAFH